MVDVNPSPPREFQDEADKFRQDMIGDTAISKKWIFSTLLDLCKEVEKHEKESEEVVDISEELQDETCRLWDLCVDREVALFLIEAKAIQIFSGIILKSNSPRLTEITAGILGNLACTPQACSAISQDEDLPSLIISLFSCRDSPTLTEVVRLINTCLLNVECRDIWLTTLESALSESLEDILFILNSSSNTLVLRGLLELLDTCLDLRSELIKKCLSEEFISAIVEAGSQLFTSDEFSNGIMHALHLLYIMTTAEDKIPSLFSCNAKVLSLCTRCCDRWCNSEVFSEGDNQSPISVASCLSVINIILDSSTDETGSTFLEDITEVERKNICCLCELVQKHCQSAENISKNSEQKEVDLLKSEICTEAKTNKKDFGSNTNGGSKEYKDNGSDRAKEEENLFDEVPLSDVVDNLRGTLRKLQWIGCEG